MPRAKQITHYPWESYSQLFKQVAHTRKPLRLASRPGMKATSMQGLLYAFRRACERSPEEALALGIDLADIQACTMREDKAAGVLIVEHREETEAAKSIRAALEEQGFRPEPRRTAADSALERVMGKVTGSPELEDKDDPYGVRR